MAAALLEGRVDYDSFDDAFADDPGMKGLMEKVELKPDDRMTAAFPNQAPCRVTVEYRGLEPLCAYCARPHGDPADPLSDEEIGAKAAGYLPGLLPQDGIGDFVERLWALESEPDLAWLLAPLQHGATHA